MLLFIDMDTKNFQYQKIYPFFLVVVLIAVLFFSFGQKNQNIPSFEADSSLKIGNKNIFLDIADTTEEQARGLSGRSQLPNDRAMLFVFQEPYFPGIWMKDMQFPIDIFWLDSNFTILTVVRDAWPDSYPKVFFPTKKSSYVLETNSGFVDENNLHVGDIPEVHKK